MTIQENKPPADYPSQLGELFRARKGEYPDQVIPIKAHGSARQIFRLIGQDGSTLVGIFNRDEAENKAFIAFSKHFSKHHLPVPKILAADLANGIYLEQDLGDTTLFDFLLENRSHDDPFPNKVEALYHQALMILPQFQIQAGRDLDYSYCHQGQVFDEQAITADFRSFQLNFLDEIGFDYPQIKLTREFSLFAQFLCQAPQDFFLYRDFQSRNIMLHKAKLLFIDYQSGRRGNLQFDVASLLYQSQAKIPDPAKDRLLHTYLNAAAQYIKLDRQLFVDFYSGFVIARLLQVLGAYGKLGFKQNRDYFLAGVPIAVDNLTNIMRSKGLPIKLPILEQIMTRLRQYDEKRRTCL